MPYIQASIVNEFRKQQAKGLKALIYAVLGPLTSNVFKSIYYETHKMLCVI